MNNFCVLYTIAWLINYTMKLQQILPQNVADCLSGTSNLMEIRLRVNKPITYVADNVVRQATFNKSTINCNSDMISSIVTKACLNSVYAYSEKIASGYITLGDGTRLGLCGDVSCEDGKIVALRNITSLNIRIPHCIIDCSASMYKHYAQPLASTLVIAPPTCGKTTFLRDMIYQINTRQPAINILVCDERNELIANDGGEQIYSSKFNCDVYSNCPKQYAFINGLRSMSPDVIVTDEIVSGDYSVLRQASNSGVKVFASIHASSISEAMLLIGETKLASIFYKLIVLSKTKGVGTIEGVYSNDGRAI